MSSTAAVKERPIPFRDLMVRRIHDGAKTQTRRVIRWRSSRADYVHDGEGNGNVMMETQGGGWWPYYVYDGNEIPLACPFGDINDRLWIRQAHWYKPASDLCPERVWDEVTGIVRSRDHNGDLEDRTATLGQTLDVGGFKKRPAMFFPRWACRHFLRVVGVRPQRLTEISAGDAVAEGIEPNWIGDPRNWNEEEHGWRRYCVHYPDGCECFPSHDPVEAFRSLWEHFRTPEDWTANPWVWALEFELLKQGV